MNCDSQVNGEQLESNDLRFRILQALLDWEHSGNSAMLEVGQLAKSFGVKVKDVVDQLDILEVQAAVEVQRVFGDGSKNTALITGVAKLTLEQMLHNRNQAPVASRLLEKRGEKRELATRAEKDFTNIVNRTANRDQVFVVHGRNETLRQSMFAFLRAVGLKPIEWNQAIAATKKASPYIGEILDVAFREAKAIIVLASGDDEARLMERFTKREDPKYETDLTPQPRPNVLFEAGLAMGRDQGRTILVEVGNLRPWSDIAGKHVTHLDNSFQKRNELAQKLKVAGCDVDLSGQDWVTAGDFGQPPNDPPTEELAIRDVVESQSAESVPSSAAEYTFSGTGPSTTRSFTIASSPWKLRYKVNWSGHFAVQVRGSSIELVVNRGVTADRVYETYVHGQVGSLHFSIQAAPPDGDWTLLVIKGDK